MKAVHLVSAMEAMSLGKKVGLDTKQLFEIIKGAAGGSWMFKERIPGLLSGEWGVGGKTVGEAVEDVVRYFLLLSPPFIIPLLQATNAWNLESWLTVLNRLKH